MNKHTPGPWTGAGPSFGDPLPRYTTEIVTEWEGDDDDVICICELPFSHYDDENEANARLIAAAPDLLAAMQGLLRGIFDGPDEANAAMLIAKARDAINKATGEIEHVRIQGKN